MNPWYHITVCKQIILSNRNNYLKPYNYFYSIGILENIQLCVNHLYKIGILDIILLCAKNSSETKTQIIYINVPWTVFPNL